MSRFSRPLVISARLLSSAKNEKFRYQYYMYCLAAFGGALTFGSAAYIYYHKNSRDRSFRPKPAVPAFPQKKLIDSFEQKVLEKELRTLFKSTMAMKSLPAIMFEVSVSGRTISKGSFGYCDLEQMTKCDPNSALFRIASISKSITGLITMQLATEGTLNLDDSIYKYLPDFPRKKVGEKEVDITVRQLMNHTSGVRHYRKKGDVETEKGQLPAELFRADDFSSLEESIKIFQDDPLEFEPGTKFGYSTYNYTLLSLVLEKASGKKFPDLANSFFGALNLPDTRVEASPKKLSLVRGKIPGYSFDSNSCCLQNIQSVNNEHKIAGGGILSTLGDLNKLGFNVAKALSGGENFQGIERKIFKQILEPPGTMVSVVPDKPNVFYSLGWRVDLQYQGFPPGVKVVYHSGAALGCSTILVVCSGPKGDWKDPIIVTLASNLTNAGLQQVAFQAVKLALFHMSN